MNRSPNAPHALNILLVEDSPTDRLITRAALKSTGLESVVQMVGNGVEALAFLRHEPPYTDAPRPHLILLDLNMPRMDGRTLLQVLKRDPVLRLIPVVVLTTSASPNDIAAAYAAQANSYITKPVDFRDFRAAMRCLEQYWFDVATVPAALPAQAPDRSRDGTVPPELQRPSGAPALVLLVEDSPSDTLICRKVLERLAPNVFEVVSAATLADALTALSSRRFDVVLTDLGLPDSGGTDVVQALRQRDAEVPIVVLTGGATPTTGADAILAGADDFLHKSELHGTALSRSLQFAIQRRQVRDERMQLQRIEAVGRLAAGVAHDFNNLLAAIAAAADVLRSDVDPEARAECLDDITETVHRGRALTRQLLASTRQDRFDPRTLDLNDVVRTTSRLLHRLLGPRIPMQLALDPSSPTVRADIHQVEQVLVNLCVNAADAMKGTGTVTIRTEALLVDAERAARIDAAMRPGRYLALRVEDDGPGIPADIRSRIFEPFFTTKRDDRGTGLGLATMRHIARQHGGAVEASSSHEDGTGATLSLYLPVSNAPTEPVAASIAGTPDHQAHAHPLAGTTVLLIEDEAALRKAMARLVERQGCTVYAAESADAAWEIWQQHGSTINAIISDLLVPGALSSTELIRRIHAEHPGLPVLYCSGFSAQFSDAELGLREGENFVAKPFTTEALLGTLGHTMRASGSPRVR